MKTTFAFVLLFFSYFAQAQLITTAKNEHQLELTVGQSFPSFQEKQDVWKATFYHAGSISFGAVHWFSPRFQLFTSYGFAAYALAHKSDVAKHTLDFVSPFGIIGVGFHQQHTKRRGYFYRLSGGAQLGYRGTEAEQYQNYSVYSESTAKFYSFVRPEIGIRFVSKDKIRGHKYKYSFEVSSFFRYNFNRLGTATFRTRNNVVVANPKGNVIGIAFRYNIPFGTKTVQKKVREQSNQQSSDKKPQDNTLFPE